MKQLVKLFIILVFASLLTLPLFTSLTIAQTPTDTTQYYEKTFSWDYNGNHWTWNISIPKALYDAYAAVPDSTRTRNGPAGYGYLTTTDDYYMRILAQKLNETTTNLKYNSYDQVSFVLAFVQSLPYASDNVTTGYDEYPRFPIETLVDERGDCEDTSILFATLTLLLGYGTVYINPPNHYAVGVLGNNLQGTYWTYENRTYYYCETTGSGFKIGQLPEEFSGQGANIYPIDETKQFHPRIIIDPTAESTPQPTQSSYVTTTTPTVTPNPNQTIPSEITDPTQHPVAPISFNLITESPLLFAAIVVAIVGSIGVAIWSVRKPRAILESPVAESTAEAEGSKFCIHCGAGNRGVAAFCEKCGKQI